MEEINMPPQENGDEKLKSATEIAMNKVDYEEIKYEPKEKLIEDVALRKQADDEKAAEILKKLKGEETEVANLDVSMDKKIESSLEK